MRSMALSSSWVRRILLYDPSMNMKRRQRGYLLEVPIIVALVGLVLAVLVPNLPPSGQKVAVVMAALVFIPCAYYMIVAPGWQPDARRLRAPWNILAFVAVAALAGFAAIAFALR